MFKAYDTAMKEFLQVKLKGKDVPLVGPVPPHRARARMQDLLKEDPRAKKDDKFVPLPFISFTRMKPVYAQERFSRADLRKLDYTKGGNRTLMARRPMPYDLSYQVDIWCEFEDDMTTLTEAYLRRWRGPIRNIEVWHGEPFGNYKIAASITDINDNSQLESDDEDRLLRTMITITLEGFLSFPATEVPTVRRIEGVAQVPHAPNTDPNTYEELLFTYTDGEDETT